MTINGTNERLGGRPALREAARVRWARAPKVLDRATRQGVMVLPPEGAAVLLTGVAARVWEALAQPLGGDQLATRLAAAGGPAALAGVGTPDAAAAFRTGGAGGAGRPGGDAGALADQVVAALADLRAIGVVREIR